MGTTFKFSSSYHPQTDGQSKEANSTVFDLLKCYVLEHKAAWERYLPLVEYADNNTVHTSTGKVPFEIVEGGKKVPPILQTKDTIFEANKHVQNVDEACRKIKIALEMTQSKHKKAADRHHRELVFSLGDWVFLRFEKARLRKIKGEEGEDSLFLMESTTPKRIPLPKECISKGSLRIHQQLECEKVRHEYSKQELEHVKKDYDDLLRDLSAGKDIQTLIPEGDGFSKFFALLQERERKKLALEFEARLAAEEKAKIYEASAEAAESRLLQLLDERTNLHLKFDEELEQKEVERVRLHSLFEKERLKSDAAKKELQDLKEKFASLLSRAPLTSGVKSDELREVFLSPRHFFKLSDVLEKRDAFENEKREEPSKLSVCSSFGDCGKAQKKFETIEDAMIERSIQLKNREACILQQVRQQDMQLKTAEDAFQELERKLKHVELDKSVLKECSDYSQTQHKNLKRMEKSTQTSSWNDGMYEKYSCVYQSPIFEHNHLKAKRGKGSSDETSETDSDERASSFRDRNEDQTDVEIRQLTKELKIIGADMLSLHKVNVFVSFVIFLSILTIKEKVD
ncbi:hypothetical protein L7F22_064218 [Adiantum nelumboides]|nr:hypothetical protein [Adiantum nelumboides]